MSTPDELKAAITEEQPLLPGFPRQTAHADSTTSLCMAAVESPNGGSVDQRRALHKRFEERLSINPTLTRRAVSYQGNRRAPGFRWMKYKEGFSSGLVERLIATFNRALSLTPSPVLGLPHSSRPGGGLKATGIEIIPVGVLTGNAIGHAANGLRPEAFREAAADLLKRVQSGDAPSQEHAFRHVRITESAFPAETETELAKAREFISAVDATSIQTMLNFACMSVLESVSYTRKDGQYLRWDHRSGDNSEGAYTRGRFCLSRSHWRPASARWRMIWICSSSGMGEGVQNSSQAPAWNIFGCCPIARSIWSSPLHPMQTGTITQGPTPLNLRGLDTTRTPLVRCARACCLQRLRTGPRESCCERNTESLPLIGAAFGMYDEQAAVHEVLAILRENMSELSNPHVVRLIEGYFLEMAVIIAELGRIVRPGGTVVMVNDNVQYHGEEVPVDLILSDYAERSDLCARTSGRCHGGRGTPVSRWGDLGVGS